MLPHMVEEMLLASECLGAEIAAMWSFPSVPHYVIREVFLTSKALPTDLTAKWGIICV